MARSISGGDGPGSDSVPCGAFVLVLPGENVGIVLIGEALLRRVTATDGRILSTPCSRASRPASNPRRPAAKQHLVAISRVRSR